MGRRSYGRRLTWESGRNPNAIAFSPRWKSLKAWRKTRARLQGVQHRIILKSFAFQYQQEEQRVIYITESVTDSLIELVSQSFTMEIFCGCGSCDTERRSQNTCLAAFRPSYLHEESPLAPLIHGHLQLSLWRNHKQMSQHPVCSQWWKCSSWGLRVDVSRDGHCELWLSRQSEKG